MNTSEHPDAWKVKYIKGMNLQSKAFHVERDWDRNFKLDTLDRDPVEDWLYVTEIGVWESKNEEERENNLTVETEQLVQGMSFGSAFKSEEDKIQWVDEWIKAARESDELSTKSAKE